MDSLLIQQVIGDQQKIALNKERGTLREIDYQKYISAKQITVISGIRRSGKSTLLLQLADRFEKYHFITFDDERLINFKVGDFNSLMLEMKKYNSSNVFVFDEVQNVEKWERFIRRLHDEDSKIFISGSNAKLLGSELATHLTGRYIKKELFPFSFLEFLKFKGLFTPERTTESISNILSGFDYYLENGGFPEFVKTNDVEYLKRIYEDIIYKDIIVRFGIRNVSNFKNLVNYLFTNFTKEISYNSLSVILGIQSNTSIKEYISFLTESYLLFEIHKFDCSLKRQYISGRKFYVIDNGLRNIVAFRNTPDNGKLLENMIFIELKRRNKEVFYYKTKSNYEIDFLAKDKSYSIIQVCYDISSGDTLNREIRALEEAMAELNIKSSLLITYNTNKTIKTGKYTIRIVPAWEWLLG